MIRKWYVLTCVATMVTAAAAALGSDEAPSRLGYRRVQENDEAVVALLAQRLAKGLQTNDPYLYSNFVIDNLSKIASNAKVIDFDLQVEQGKVSLRCVKNGESWQVVGSDELTALAQRLAKSAHGKLNNPSTISLLGPAAGPSEDKTFISRELAPEHQISILSRRVTNERLQRQLFSLPTGSTLFAKVRQFDTAPYFQASYVQLVTDPAWNRIVYGDYQKWIKAYNAAESGQALSRPQGIVVDPNGVVYVADMGNSRILVLQLSGPANEVSLSYRSVIGSGELSQPTELAWDDRGTIFDASDDLLWVIDRGANALLAYSTGRPATAVVTYEQDSFVDLSALAIGRFDGRSDGNIYLADAGARKIHRLYYDGTQIIAVATHPGESEMTPSALATDHWGNVYLADEAHRKIQKFSPALELLSELRSEDANFQPTRFQPLFGSISTSPDKNIWSGYDQAFLLEKWTDNSGGRRYELGIDFHLDNLQVTDDLSTLALSGKLTDPGQLKLEMVPATGNAAASSLADSWYNSGNVQLNWDRRLSNGEMIAPGYYKLRQILRSTYEKPEVVQESAAFYLPLYYYDDCGVVGHDAHLARGTRTTIYGSAAGQTLVTDNQEVIYQFKGLNPALAYEMKATYFSGAGQVEQALYAEQNLIHSAVTVGQAPHQSQWLAVPPQAVADRQLDLRFVKTGGNGGASVAEVWLREANFNPHTPPAPETVSEQLPEHFALRQNYPNPFNPSTTIEFSIPQGYRGSASLRVYNMLGEVVRELVAGELAPGNYRHVWDGLDNSGRRLASGLYIYQLRAGSFSATRKLLLMK